MTAVSQVTCLRNAIPVSHFTSVWMQWKVLWVQRVTLSLGFEAQGQRALQDLSGVGALIAHRPVPLVFQRPCRLRRLSGVATPPLPPREPTHLTATSTLHATFHPNDKPSCSGRSKTGAVDLAQKTHDVPPRWRSRRRIREVT